MTRHIAPVILTVMIEPMRLRPFRKHLERERHLPMLEVAGRIEGKRFIVSAIGYEIGLDTIEVGDDERGPYALVNEGEQTLPNGFKVRVEVEPDEHLPPGAVIDVIFEGRTRDEAREGAPRLRDRSRLRDAACPQRALLLGELQQPGARERSGELVHGCPGAEDAELTALSKAAASVGAKA